MGRETIGLEAPSQDNELVKAHGRLARLHRDLTEKKAEVLHLLRTLDALRAEKGVESPADSEVEALRQSLEEAKQRYVESEKKRFLSEQLVDLLTRKLKSMGVNDIPSVPETFESSAPREKVAEGDPEAQAKLQRQLDELHDTLSMTRSFYEGQLQDGMTRLEEMERELESLQNRLADKDKEATELKHKLEELSGDSPARG